MTQEELDLLHSYLAETITEGAMIRLNTLLRENSDARSMLRTLSTVDIKLRTVAAVPPLSVPQPGNKRVIRSWHALAAACVLIAALAWLAWQPSSVPRQGLPRELATTNAVSEDGWTVPTDGLLGELPTTARLTEDISALLKP